MKELIYQRWQESASNYGKSVLEELKNPDSKWRKFLKEKANVKDGMKILEPGCGPGFISITLAGKGREVYGIDISDYMIEEARKNSEFMHSNALFQVMSGMDLEFDDSTFDMVISRNVVWTLEDPEQAYREWVRVLKQGGELIVFDAAWNREYHDKAVMERKKELRRLAGVSQEPEYFCSKELGLQLDQQSALGDKKRPEWDQQILENLGMDLTIDTEVWKVLWTEEEQILSGATPMFMIRGVKN